MPRYKGYRPKGRGKSKYNAQKICVDGMTFDSIREFRRYCCLEKMKEKGFVRDIRRQVVFPLLPAQYEQLEEIYVKGPKKGQHKQGVCLERSVNYVADFVYEFKDLGTGKWCRIVEDAKGFRTDDYVLKRKLMLWIHGIRVREV